jgi:D-alanyl-D-alanine carboxypeptidase
MTGVRGQLRRRSLIVLAVIASLWVAPAAASARGFSPTQVQQLTSTIRTTMADDGYPGFVVGIWGPSGKRYVRAFGAADLATARRPIGTTDRFRVGSITKTLVGTLILRLVQERRLSLEEPLSHFYKWIPHATQITIRMLLDHTSLIPGFATSTLLQFQSNRAMRFVPDQVIRAAVAEPYFQSPPLFNYSDINYVILGRIAERVTRQPLARLLAKRILMPLGLHNTYFDPGTTIRGVHAHGYVVSGHKIDVTNWTTSYGWAAGSMVSTLGDLKAWASDLVRGARLDRAIQRQRLRFIATPAGYGYGLGIIQLGEFCGHNGLIPGYDSTMLYSSRLHATIVILANASPLLDSPALSNPFPPPPAVPDTLNVAVRLLPIAFPQLGSPGTSPAC